MRRNAMKDKIVSGIGIVVVLLLIFVSVKFLQNGNPFSAMMSENGDKAVMQQKGKPSKESMELAKQYQEEVRMEIDPGSIVPVGKPINDGEYVYQAESWKITKEDPGYPLPKYMDSLKERFGVEQDESGRITNDYSFVTVNLTVENPSKKDKTDLIWAMKLRSGSLGTEAAAYLGETQPREYGRRYAEETIPAKGKVTMPLIWVIKDELLEGHQLFVEINRTGVVGGKLEDGKDARRCIALDDQGKEQP